ncbi:15855_t:CDS:2, partial [Funneliformis geosporum]
GQPPNNGDGQPPNNGNGQPPNNGDGQPPNNGDGKPPNNGNGQPPNNGDGKPPNNGNGQPPNNGDGQPDENKKKIDTKTIEPTATCGSPDDPGCKPPPGVTPKIETAVQEEVAATAAAVEDPNSIVSDSNIIQNFNSHGLWGVMISLAVIATSLIFMIVA